jgi:hypothetical protein
VLLVLGSRVRWEQLEQPDRLEQPVLLDQLAVLAEMDHQVPQVQLACRVKLD